jgi:hypothetical protein
MSDLQHIWVFHGSGARFCSAVFSSKFLAEEWIRSNALSGMLTLYPINKSVYDWAIENGTFSPKKEHQTTPDFIQQFSSASQEHYHYENGELDSPTKT